MSWQYILAIKYAQIHKQHPLKLFLAKSLSEINEKPWQGKETKM